MSLDNLFQILVAVAVVIFWLFGEARRRPPSNQEGAPPRRPGAQGRPRRPRPVPQRTETGPARGRAMAPRPAPVPEPPRDRALEELADLLGIQLERPGEPEPPFEAESLETIPASETGPARSRERVPRERARPRPPADEARSLEVLTPRASRLPAPTPASGPAAALPTSQPPAPARPRVLSRRGLRRAVVWREILGPPKALQ